MSLENFVLWQAYELATGRITGQRADYLTAIQTDVIARSVGGMRKTKLTDWIPDFAPKQMTELEHNLSAKQFFSRQRKRQG